MVQPLRIAVAPFVGEGAQLKAAETLTGRLARRPIERLIAPDVCVTEVTFDPRAALVRQWAYDSAVDTVIVGRVRTLEDSPSGGGWRVETVLHSGHSGAEFARQAVDVASPAEIDASIEQLAVEILEDLGYREEESAMGRAAIWLIASPIAARHNGEAFRSRAILRLYRDARS